MKHHYFSFRELAIILSIVFTSTILNFLYPILIELSNFSKITYSLLLGLFNFVDLVYSPVTIRIALFGGFLVVFWITLAYRVIGKKYTGIVTSLFLISFLLLTDKAFAHAFSPYLIPWNGLVGIVSLFLIGLFIELTGSNSFRGLIGGGIGNLLFFTLLSFSLYLNVTHLRMIQLEFMLLLDLVAFISGCIGVLLVWLVKK